MANVFEPEFDAVGENGGFSMRTASVGRQAGAEQLGARLWELAPGETATPFHYHRANEEMLIVLAGHPHLRTPSGWHELDEGEVVAFRTGPVGAHQLQNRSDAPARFLIVSGRESPDIVVYPDSGKLAARDVPRGGEDSDLRGIFRLIDNVDYLEGESPPDAG